VVQLDQSSASEDNGPEDEPTMRKRELRNLQRSNTSTQKSRWVSDCDLLVAM